MIVLYVYYIIVYSNYRYLLKSFKIVPKFVTRPREGARWKSKWKIINFGLDCGESRGCHDWRSPVRDLDSCVIDFWHFKVESSFVPDGPCCMTSLNFTSTSSESTGFFQSNFHRPSLRDLITIINGRLCILCLTKNWYETLDS